MLELSLEGKFREYQNAGVQVFFGVGEIILVGIAYSFPQWRILALYWIAIPIAALNVPIFFILESPKYTPLNDRDTYTPRTRSRPSKSSTKSPESTANPQL
jgi:hypothetical protein